jgi:hypothetical protein
MILPIDAVLGYDANERASMSLLARISVVHPVRSARILARGPWIC